MKPARWTQIERLFNQAMEMEESRRTAFLHEACAGDDDLRQDLEQLLAEELPAGSFLEKPALREIAHEFAATAATAWVGRQIGNYQFVSLVGAGGMGEVYQARDTKLKREVAIKILPERFSSDRDRVSNTRTNSDAFDIVNPTENTNTLGREPANLLSAFGLGGMPLAVRSRTR